MTVRQLADRIGLKTIAAPEDELAREVSGCYVGDLLSWVMGRARKGDAWVTIMTNLNVAAVASLAEIALVVIAEGCEPDENLRRKALDSGVCLFGSPKSSYSVACDIYEAFKEETA